MFTIKVNMNQIEEVLSLLDPRKAGIILTRTLNKTGAQGKTALSRAIRETYNIKKERVDKAMSVRSASPSTLAYTVKTTERPPGLQHYDARQTTRMGVTVKVTKASGRKPVRGGFMAKTPQGALAVWKLTGEPKRFMKKGRYAGTHIRKEPIKRLYGPSIPGMINHVGIGSFEDVVDQKLDQIFSHEFEYEMSKK